MSLSKINNDVYGLCWGLLTTDSCKPMFVKHKILTLLSLYTIEVEMFVKDNPHLISRLSIRCDDSKSTQQRYTLYTSI